MTLRLSLGRSNRKQRGHAGKWWRKDWRDGWKERDGHSVGSKKLTEMEGSRKKRIGEEKEKEFKGRRGWCAISIAPENIHLLLPRSGLRRFPFVFFFFFFFFFLFFSVAFYATRIDKNTGTYPLSIALQPSILRCKVFRNYWYRVFS